ncbi:MAG: hypothetical protein NT069_02310, partial [Planctomycetota bacterium]|nr:hypothetical protein [Planctomycetota bacterium]
MTPPQEGTESLFGHLWILKGNLGLVEDSATAAEEAFRKSITILKPLALAEPNGPFAQDYARGCYSVSILLNDRNESGEALQFARETLQQQLVFDPENRLLALGVQIEIARSLSRLRRTTEADLVFMAIIRQLIQLPMTSEKQPAHYSHILLRCWVAHVEHQRLCGRDELAATQQAAIEAYIQRPMCGIALGKFQELSRPDFVAQTQTATGIYPQVFAKVIVETALETVDKRYMEQMVLGRTEEALATARLGLREASKKLSPDDWSLASLTQFAKTCEETLRLPEKSQQLVTEAFRLQALSLRSPNPRDMAVATRDSVSKIEEAFSPHHPHALLLRYGLATHEFKSGDLKAAQAELAGIAEPLEHAFGTASPLVAEFWLWSARAEQLAGEPVIAEQLARRALAILEPLIVREGNPKQIVGYVFGKSILAEIHRGRGEFEAALELTWQVSDLLSIVNAPFVDRADISQLMAKCLVQTGRLEEATALLDRWSFSALAQMKNKRSPCPPQIAFGSYTTYAQHMRQTGQTDEADAL